MSALEARGPKEHDLTMAVSRLFAMLAGTLMMGACVTSAPTVGGYDYAPQYDFSEFFAVTDLRTFRVIVAGNPFPDLSQVEFQRRLRPVMQANRPRPRLTFTYAVPPELPRPDYRLVMVFDAANDLTAARVCAGQVMHKPRGPADVGRFSVFAVYCRNDLALSQALASTPATGPDDPRVGELLAQLFQVLFTDAPLFSRPGIPFGVRL